MFLTVEKLIQLNACKQGIKYIEKFFPSGAELIDIINARHIPKEFLHWGRENLSISQNELVAYCKVCGIENTTGFWYSEAVKNSMYVVKSKNIEDSRGIFGCTDVTNSTDAVCSEDVANSSQIFDSSIIDSSSKVFKGKNVLNGQNIYNSTMIAKSKNVFESSNVFSSSEIIKSKDITNSYFCQNCINVRNSMFCFGISDAEYHIFNQPVDKERFELFVQQYNRLMNVQLAFSQEWKENLIGEYRPLITQKFDDWYKPIPQKFWKWVRTLPNFDSMLIYDITMLPEILIDN